MAIGRSVSHPPHPLLSLKDHLREEAELYKPEVREYQRKRVSLEMTGLLHLGTTGSYGGLHKIDLAPVNGSIIMSTDGQHRLDLMGFKQQLKLKPR